MTSIRSISREIHKRRSILFLINKAEQGIFPYFLSYKDPDYRRVAKVRNEKELKALKLEREIIKNVTPREKWYPQKRYCGRYNNKENDIKTKIMREAFLKGFNVKSIAAYFDVEVSGIYRRIKIKKLVNNAE